MKDILKVRRFRSKLNKKELLKDYMIGSSLNIDELINQYYGYVYMIVKNSKSIYLSNEDMEEIISDVFFAIWKNSKNLAATVEIKPYLAGIIKNTMKNKYRTSKIYESIDDYENTILDTTDYEKMVQENEQNEIIKDTLQAMKQEEYEIFMMFYYEAKKIKQIADSKQISESKVKVTLHRIRKQIRKNLRKGGYGYGK